ncbi:ABC transporter substrate-binding protein [Glaciibacter psychrotolerans]|uniref:Multiple sugar transport system substrate-binding protein n=1 Tax=Glaciibacter psychrotolerans TaxID=670054 RepID=A0A7Z0EG86_9MICO|nr:sugar ABC transporter substrate-binding protein [Leifsonia psychrotolerans]NYJ21102.1 multiple sugar transport system substrate-binding protein [Leifsonia psychrotolerans]
MNSKHTRTIAVALLACSAVALTGCSAVGSEAASDDVTLTYSLWDPNQLPAYQECATDFTAKTGIKVEITQQGWDDYWKTITTGIVSGTAPDVITDHVAYYPELADNNQLLDLQPYVDKDKVDLTQYTGDLASLWVKDGKRYGLPQDWDTIALVYNTADVKDAGIDAASLNDLTWNPTDGGSFGKAIAHLTIDKAGVRGDEPGFDKDNVATYGWGLEAGGGVVGQTQWSWSALSTGFEYLNENPFGTEFQLADPRLAETLGWWQNQIKAGFVVPLEQAGQLGLEPQLLQNKAAMISDGSWRINTWANATEQDLAFAKLPVGPEGRKTIINGLAPSITAGTKHPDQAWELVKFIGSADCQNIVAKTGVVFPAIPAAAQASAAVRTAQGIDVTPFLEEALDPAGIAYYPITLHANAINSDAQAVIDEIQQQKAVPKDALSALNDRVNALFK